MKILYQINLQERHTPQTKNEEKVFAKKSLKRNHYQKYFEIVYQRILKETFPAKGLKRGIFTKNILKTCLPKCV